MPHDRPPGKEQRPGGESEALNDCWAAVTTAQDTDLVRCECCRRPLRAARSVELGRGPVCLRGAA